MKKWRPYLISAIRMIALLYVLLVGILFFYQERLIFIPEKLESDFRFDFQAPFEERTIAHDGGDISTLLFRVPQSKGLILYFHGNAGSLRSWGEVARELSARTGFSVWIMDYPGYGKSLGSIQSESQLHAIALKFYETAKAENTGEPIVIYGRSIGSGMATRLASEQALQGLILESPYYGLKSLAAQIAPWAPLYMLKYNFPNFEWIRKVKAPVLIVHGDQDEVIPHAQGQRLASLTENALFVTIPDGQHNDLGDHDLYWKALVEFLGRL